MVLQTWQLEKEKYQNLSEKIKVSKTKLLIGDLTIKNIPHILAFVKRRAGDRKRIESDKEIHSNVRPLTTGKRSSIWIILLWISFSELLGGCFVTIIIVKRNHI